MMYEFKKPIIVDIDKFTETFGIRVTPIRDAIRETEKLYRYKYLKFPKPVTFQKVNLGQP